MTSDLQVLRVVGKGHRVYAELDEVNYSLELALDGQRWTRTGRLGTPFHPALLNPNPKGF